MLKRTLLRTLSAVILLLWLAIPGAVGDVYYQNVDLLNRSDRPYSSIQLKSCDVYLHIDEYGTQEKTADCIYFSGDAQVNLSAPGDSFIFEAWPNEHSPMMISSCEIWEMTMDMDYSEGSVVLLALHWQDTDGTERYVSDLVVTVDNESAWGYDRVERDDGITIDDYDDGGWNVILGDWDTAARSAEMAFGYPVSSSDIQEMMDKFDQTSIRLDRGVKLEEDRYFTWSRNQTDGFDATCGLYQSIDEVCEPFEEVLSYRLGRALYDAQTHQQVATVYSRVNIYDVVLVSSVAEEIVCLQPDAEP